MRVRGQGEQQGRNRGPPPPPPPPPPPSRSENRTHAFHRLRNTHPPQNHSLVHAHTHTRTHTYVTPNSWCPLHFQNSWVKYGPSVVPLRLFPAAVWSFAQGSLSVITDSSGPWVHSNTNVFHFQFVSVPSSGVHNTGTSVLKNLIHTTF